MPEAVRDFLIRILRVVIHGVREYRDAGVVELLPHGFEMLGGRIDAPSTQRLARLPRWLHVIRHQLAILASGVQEVRNALIHRVLAGRALQVMEAVRDRAQLHSADRRIRSGSEGGSRGQNGRDFSKVSSCHLGNVNA
jgi:hypothetical protein